MSIRKEYRVSGLSGSRLNFIVNIPNEALMARREEIEESSDSDGDDNEEFKMSEEQHKKS